MCYQIFIRGLLDLTDNWVEGQIIPPPQVVCRDGEDPYLVVAADKGTATFSNYANTIAQEYGFWLGDAFASGGSAGYDHKKMGITARGAWKAVEHHFRALEKSASDDPLTVVGIGDMAGDVFGNGMLLSQNLKLVAAFNHQHIFLDPNPDAAASYKERLRLFHMPSSTWMDYSPQVLSPGGGIFSRSAKSIPLSAEVRHMLDVAEENISPSALIQILLKSSVDLLWFGGIGTFIKASSEGNGDVNDRLNDTVRINGHEVRAHVVGEGANLGFTQKGRIEYALKGGKLNTDAIDNSAGVDCSDHEVNIKILVQPLLTSGVLTLAQRNRLLESMTEEVARLVLSHNYWQNEAIALAHHQGPELLEMHNHFMRDLEAKNRLNRTLECLPEESEITRRHDLHKGLTRPELAVLLAYGKIDLYQDLLASDILDDTALTPYLVHYFPQILSQQFPEALQRHALKKEIIATVITNHLVNLLGFTFVHGISRLVSCPVPNVVKAVLVAERLLNLNNVEDILEEASLDMPVQIELLKILTHTVKTLTLWLLENAVLTLPIEDILMTYQEGFKYLSENLGRILPPSHRGDLTEKNNSFLKIAAKNQSLSGATQQFISQVIMFEPLVDGANIILIAHATSISLEKVSKLYYLVGETFGIRWVQRVLSHLHSEDYWQRQALRIIREEISEIQKKVTSQILHHPQDASLEAWIQRNQERVTAYTSLLKEMMSLPTVEIASLTVLCWELRQLSSLGSA